jgi:hypothetical protein
MSGHTPVAMPWSAARIISMRTSCLRTILALTSIRPLAPGDHVSLLTATPNSTPERHPGGGRYAQPADEETTHNT